MKKVKPKTKEQTVYFLVSNISLGTYDKKFLTNLESLHITLGKPLTTNQAALLDKIILRYRRQLRKLEIDADELIALEWNTKPIPSSPQFTEVHILLVDDELILRSPYKKDFVTEFRSLELSSSWVSEDKFWRMPANSYTLSKVKSCVEKHYTKINYCENLQELLDTIKQYEGPLEWNPTLVYTNGNYIVFATTEVLDEVTKTISFDNSLKSLSRVTALGIKIHESVYNKYLEIYDKADLDFFIEKISEVEHTDSSLCDKITRLEPDIVLMSTLKLYGLSEVKSELEKNNIKCHVVNQYSDYIDTRSYEFPIFIGHGITTKNHSTPIWAKKIIMMVNSHPIKLNERM